MTQIERQIRTLYKKNGSIPPWSRQQADNPPSAAGKIMFLGTAIIEDEKPSKTNERRVRALHAYVFSSAQNNRERVGLIVRELLRSRVITSEDGYKALPVIKEWVGLVFGRKPVREWEDRLRKIVPGFLSEKEPSVEQRTFCFLLDNQFIPHEKFEFSSELKQLFRGYQRHQKDPKRGLSEAEKGELSRIIGFFRFLQLNNDRIVAALMETVRAGLRVDPKKHAFILTENERAIMENDDIRWRILRTLRWSPNYDDKLVSLMKAFVASPNWAERLYAMGYLGRAAGRLYHSQPHKSHAIIKYILDKRVEMIKGCSSVVVLEIVKVLMGDWDARQPFQRRYLFGCPLCHSGLKAIAEDERVEPAVRRNAVQALQLFAEKGRDPGAAAALSSLLRSKSPLCRDEAGLALKGDLPKLRPRHEPRIVIEASSMQHVGVVLQNQERMAPYTRQKDWLLVGVDLERGTYPFDIGVRDGQWLAVRKISPFSLKLPKRYVIPAIERTTFALGWALGLRSLGKVQMVEDEGSRDSYFSYFVGQLGPLSESFYNHLVQVQRAREALSRKGKGSQGIHLGKSIRDVLLDMHGGRDMDSERMERDSRYGELIRGNRIGSTIAFMDGREREAGKWFEAAGEVLTEPKFFDQVKFFNWIVGNEDQYGYRNMVIAGKRQKKKGRPFLIDFASCFTFLQNQDLDWRAHLKRFDSNVRMIARHAPAVFIENVKPLIINFLSLPAKAIRDILDEIRYGELTEEEKKAVYLLLLAEKEILAKELL